MLHVAVVGSGPSGVYTAQTLVAHARSGNPGEPGAAAHGEDVRVDVLDRLPCPYGLVRYGVAPDHEKIKSLQNNLRTVLDDPHVRFLGGVEVGPGRLSPAQLLELYDAVVYCVGAATDRQLGIPGEDLPGSCSATEFVSWYSAHPDATANGSPQHGVPHRGRSFVRDVRSAVVIGVGNVAVDVTRILARGADELRPTDMPQAALDALAGSAVRDVHMVGRRGPSQAKFTTKELRELGTLADAEVLVDPAELALDPACADPSSLPAANRRNVEVLKGWSEQPPHGSGAGSGSDSGSGSGPDAGSGSDSGSGASVEATRRIHLRFFLRPVELLEAEGRVGAVRFERTVPDGAGGVRGTGQFEDIQAELVLRSVGYRGVPLEGMPFDPASGTVPHEAGRVLRAGHVSPGEYVAGWIKRGPTGVIGTNRPCAKETVNSLLEDAAARPRSVRDRVDDPLTALRALGLRPVEWSGWESIEHAEAALGASLGRGPVKIPDWEGLFAAAREGAGNGD
ncbi:FAD-dependent oxidoreductase [Streptomyces luteolus]|uniref:ferredoxin--NADP(+) reductase n=1 Tax=Streptomyces luteolus TaxID=3043615 RepID=A0ABT6T2B6_9ACTN|nr:FAD-dependent oxidoreductase [Streptomyces sp. B-S-A12]MDI3421493.1 NADP oxidoreductase [Streptomyces sp. B-S-A12]